MVSGMFRRMLWLLVCLGMCSQAFAQGTASSTNLPADAPPFSASSESASADLTFDASAKTPAFSALIDPFKEEEILKMMKLLNVQERMEKVKQSMLDQMRRRMPNVPSKIWDRVAKDIDVNVLMQRKIAIYDKCYTMEDLKALNAFYSSPAGQRVVARMPELEFDFAAADRAWMQQAILKIRLELEDAKLVVPAAPPASSSPTPPVPATNSAPAQPSAPKTPMHPEPANHMT